ncbi:alpha-1,4 glucan phosphorylase L-2 isozyme, chloroplastic/amyloplastic-like isoform X1 [Hibiscus syriacus]|uniref:alpha-1,4 glucan phosphorylase L-2 isozyme, chloroplastic/amyloplastic-like isoform X1 n=2 Tax=Hibiscus syriacus TaxID=106335 RepID=UPI0019217EAC|nr:alpha-1,4 glucan phosphorylase L-2 isozyme, chloroplastic/amyloplastic-like isoform X1 [Hibiscus syriacus]
MFDVQTKRVHEYKRQLLNIFGIIHRYECFKHMDKNDRKKVVPRVCILGGKAAPGYEMAKKIIKLCHLVAEKINNDKDIGDLLKLAQVTKSYPKAQSQNPATQQTHISNSTKPL